MICFQTATTTAITQSPGTPRNQTRTSGWSFVGLQRGWIAGVDGGFKYGRTLNTCMIQKFLDFLFKNWNRFHIRFWYLLFRCFQQWFHVFSRMIPGVKLYGLTTIEVNFTPLNSGKVQFPAINRSTSNPSGCLVLNDPPIFLFDLNVNRSVHQPILWGTSPSHRWRDNYGFDGTLAGNFSCWPNLSVGMVHIPSQGGVRYMGVS